MEERAKLKAQELKGKFYSRSNPGHEIECALICVEEMLTTLKTVYSNIYGNTIDFHSTGVFSAEVKFYNRVKSILEQE